MALRNVIKMGDDILRKISKPVAKFDDNLAALLDDMAETMYKAKGMGLAAVQVGVLKRAVIIDVNNMFCELINPEIIHEEGEDIEEEGCLSVEKKRDMVKRPFKLTVRAQDRFGNFFELTGEKYLARCISHEIDHLNGILFIDKICK